MTGKAKWQARGPWEITRDKDTDYLLEKRILNVLCFILIVYINSTWCMLHKDISTKYIKFMVKIYPLGLLLSLSSPFY